MPTENRSSNTENLPCPFCAGRVDPEGWLRGDGTRGPECESCGATAPTLSVWNSANPTTQPHPDPIAWMVGTAFWWTKEEAERDAEATGLPIVGLGPMTGADEAERLRDVVKHSDNQIMRQSLRISNQRTQLADRLALLREALEFIDDGVGRSDAEWRLIKKLRAALSPDGAAGASDEPYQGMPGTSFQRLNALANQGE
ncbi:hypothetical protein [Pseudomonas juntendi]|uniref:hypothetical protein n=1 Tax=Pseudomonas juntendi TaxID=2666183 RepID=UPI001F34603B|nr:hypothetical protein [Pseudomonas juntendi]